MLGCHKPHYPCRESYGFLRPSPEGQLYLGRIKREAAAGRGRELSMPILFSVRPHLEFCIQAWSPQLKEEVEVLEQVCRRPWR